MCLDLVNTRFWSFSFLYTFMKLQIICLGGDIFINRTCGCTHQWLHSFPSHSSVDFTGTVLLSKAVKALGVTSDSYLTFQSHIPIPWQTFAYAASITSGQYITQGLLIPETCHRSYTACLLSRQDHANAVFAGVSILQVNRLWRIQNSLACVVHWCCLHLLVQTP